MSEIIRVEKARTQSFHEEDELVQVGQWYWVPTPKADRKYYPERGTEWLGCVVEVGSNYAKLEEARGGCTQRWHLDTLTAQLRREHDPRSIILGKVQAAQKEVAGLLGEVKSITLRLGVSPRVGIGQEANSTALATLSGAPDVADYKTALIKAKDEELPELFKKIEEANEDLAEWMTAETIPLKALAQGAENVVEEINGRIFNVSLYAGLTEQVVKIRDGDPAPFDERLRVLQRRAYMDEECLLNYRLGGMEFKDIKDFDKWMSEPENFTRILPYPRCLISMQVRREDKERSWGGDPMQAWINIEMAKQDKLTFLYLRNGDRLYRMDCDLEFGPLLFPEKEAFDSSRPARMNNGAFAEVEFISEDEFEVTLAKIQERERLSKKWLKDNPKRTWIREWHKTPEGSKKQANGRWSKDPEYAYDHANPYREAHFDESSDRYEQKWTPFNSSNLHYDEGIKSLSDRAQQYNRIALIIQGLFDRSEVFHPHPPVQTWSAEGFAAAIELVYDGSGVLHDGPAPDFIAYRAELNASLSAHSVVIGQEEVWLDEVRAEETERRGRDYRLDQYARKVYDTWRPQNDEGPGFLAKVSDWDLKKGKATFTWQRGRRNASWRNEDERVKDSLTVPGHVLFNVSAYRKGDYLRFFRDPRTRASYIKWAPALLTAEEWLAGNCAHQKPLGES